MTTITIPRSGDAPLKFTGERIAHFDGERFAGREQNRWYEIALYRVRDDRYVVHVGFRSRWQGESGRDDCYQGGASEIRAALKDHDPIPERVGFPAGEQYRERQAALVSALREQYAAAVREILSRDEFAVSLEEAQDDEYAALDRKETRPMTTEQLIQSLTEAGYQIHVGFHLGEINVALRTSPLCVDVDSYGETLHEALTKAHAAVLAMADDE